MSCFFDVIIIGAGASGFCCAVQALARGKNVAILEHNSLPLKKVKISGGGRCNFTNMNACYKNYLTSFDKENLIKKTLQNFSPEDFFKLIKKHKIKPEEKSKGQFFAADSSQQIIDMLLSEAKNAKIFCNIEIDNIEKDEESFSISTSKKTFLCKSLVIATGGMSYQNIGASDFGYKVAKQFGLKIIPYKPALVPFNIDSAIMKDLASLQGVALNARVECNGKVFNDNILFTHFGISGPAVLQASLYWNSGNKIKIDMLPDVDIIKELKTLRETSKGRKISSVLSKYLPNRFVEYITNSKDCFISEASNKLILEIGNRINNWEVVPAGTQGYKLAEVTSGGVSLDEIEETFESKKNKNLFFIGEVLDVTGQLGGYNLQWAWSSGFIAGKYV